MTIDLSCPDWEDRLRAGLPPIREGIPVDALEAERAVAAFNLLRLYDVPGTPTMAEACGDWFRVIVGLLFGSLAESRMSRAIREVFALVPKKNSKTTNGALLMLTALLLNERPSAPFGFVAPVQDTADEAFAAVEGAIGLDPVLDKLFHVRAHLKTIIHRETKADLQIVTFDPDVLTGRKWAGVMIDELHVIAKNPKAAKAMRQIRGGMLPFPEAFLLMITTMPDGPPVGIMRAELAKARAIRDGSVVNVRTLPVLYELPRAVQKSREAWTDPKAWPMVTPNLGRSVSLERLREMFDEAALGGEEELRGWASQHLNIEVGVALNSDRWPGADYWEAGAEDPIDLEALLERCEVVDVGIDGGGLDDLLGLCVVGREKETRRWLAWFRGWAHRSVLERRKAEASTLLDFARAGDLAIVRGAGDAAREDGVDEIEIGEDFAQVAAIAARCEAAGKLDKVGVDPYGIGGILDALVTAKVPKEKIVGISQGWKLGAAIKTTERKLAEGVLVHGGQALAAWSVGNAKIEPKGNAILVTKQASGSAKIDPLMALFNAVSLMALDPNPPTPPDHRFFFV